MRARAQPYRHGDGGGDRDIDRAAPDLFGEALVTGSMVMADYRRRCHRCDRRLLDVGFDVDAQQSCIAAQLPADEYRRSPRTPVVGFEVGDGADRHVQLCSHLLDGLASRLASLLQGGAATWADACLIVRASHCLPPSPFAKFRASPASGNSVFSLET